MTEDLNRGLRVWLQETSAPTETCERAFKKQFGCAPSQWKMQKPAATGKNRKISQENRSFDQARSEKSGYVVRMTKTKSVPLQVAVETRPSAHIAYLRYQGPFGEPVGKFWQEQVYPWMAANHLLGAPRYGISHDDPFLTNDKNCRYDAGVEVDPDYVPSQNAPVATLPGGLYACARFKGTSSNIGEAWNWILREWLPSSGYQLDSRDCLEYYPPDAEFDETTGAFTCDLCVPVSKL